MSTKPSLTIKRRLKAPPQKVYAAWTDPAKITHWWGPEQAQTLSAELDVRVGGRFHIVFRTPDREEHDVSGTYREVIPNRKLVFTWMWRTMPERQSLVTVTLAPDGEGTLLTLLQSSSSTSPRATATAPVGQARSTGSNATWLDQPSDDIVDVVWCAWTWIGQRRGCNGVAAPTGGDPAMVRTMPIRTVPVVAMGMAQ
jgi:uncharacterized protein YndB with AHSA1/START domain